MVNRKTHGERNKKLSEDLLEGKVYYDWVITTSFYSAIHFVEDFIFPCNIRQKECKNISQAKKALKMPSRHATRKRLVLEKMPPGTSEMYDWLDDRSRTARYTTFKQTPEEAAKSKDYLAKIHKECYKNINS